MSYKTKRIIPILGMLLVFGYAAAKVVSSDAEEIKQPLPPGLSNLSGVNLVEIKDAGGQVVLSGSFTAQTAKAGEVERTAALTGAGVAPDAAGMAEIEISTENSVEEHELEVEVERLAPGAAFKLFVDGQEAAAFTTGSKGAAELEMSNHPSR